jgi:Cu-Zn family superoxide dismutase
MDSKISSRYAALIGAAALVVGCGPDASEREGSAQDRAPDSSVSRGPSDEPRDTAARPPTTVPNPAGPGAAAAPATPPPAITPRLLARAEIRPVADNTVRGIVEFQQAASSDGPLTIHVMLMGLPAGPHGMHVHTGADCMEPGEHLNPLNAPHGPANAASSARHLGDLGNVTADASGTVDEMLRDSLLAGDTTFVGKALVVHTGQDDLSTQPDGSSGEPIGCGVIEAADEDVLSRAGDANRGV